MNKWPIVDVPVSRLRFDKLNARFLRKYDTRKKIISYLIENYAIAELTRKIVKSKYMTGDLIVVIPKGNNFEVIEGNRRLCALIAITNFDEIPQNYKADFPNIPESLKQDLLHIPVSVAPDRKAAEHYVTERHLSSSKVEWSVPSKITRTALKYFEDKEDIPQIASDLGMSISDVKRDLREYALYKYALELDWSLEEKKVLVDEKLRLNPFLYVFQAKNVISKLCIKFENNYKLVSELDPGVFKNIMKRIAAATLIPNDDGKFEINTRSKIQTFIDQLLETYVHQVDDHPVSDNESTDTATPGDEIESGAEQKTETDQPVDTPTTNPNRIYTHLSNSIAQDQIIGLVEEVSKIPYKSYPNASAALLRTFFEAILRYHFGPPESKKSSTESLINWHINKKTYGTSMNKVLNQYAKNGLVTLDLIIHGNQIAHPDSVRQVADQMYVWVKKALSITEKSK